MPSRRDVLKTITLAAVTNPRVSLGATPDPKPNILLVIVDDLNCCISPYTPEQGVVSPNFERLRDWGAMFERLTPPSRPAPRRARHCCWDRTR